MVAWRPDEFRAALVAAAGHVCRPWPHALALVRDPGHHRWPDRPASRSPPPILDSRPRGPVRDWGGVLAFHCASMAPDRAGRAAAVALAAVAGGTRGLAAGECVRLAWSGGVARLGRAGDRLDRGSAGRT